MFDALKLALIATVTVPAAVLAIIVGSVDPHGKVVYSLGRFWTWIILKIGGISVTVEGLKRIDSGKPYIFMVNHQSNMDIPALIHALSGFQLRWIAKKELLRVPFFGWAVRASKHIIVDRTDRLTAAKSLQIAKRRLQAGISIVIFPEGTRSTNGKLLPFKKGGFVLATRTNTPVVPVAINGSGAILPVGSWRLTPGMIEVRIGEPLLVDGYGPANLRLLSTQVRRAIETHLRAAANLTAGNPRTTTEPAHHQAPFDGAGLS
jgi:1-acyl-sn-glycerol-3-phosphate acyltransferase